MDTGDQEPLELPDQSYPLPGSLLVQEDALQPEFILSEKLEVITRTIVPGVLKIEINLVTRKEEHARCTTPEKATKAHASKGGMLARVQDAHERLTRSKTTACTQPDTPRMLARRERERKQAS